MFCDENLTKLPGLTVRIFIDNTSGLKEMSYKQKIRELGLTTLEERWRQFDVPMVHKIMQKESGLEPETLKVQ